MHQHRERLPAPMCLHAAEVEGRASASVDRLQEQWKAFGRRSRADFDAAMGAATERARVAAKPATLHMFLSHGLLEGLLACIGAKAPCSAVLDRVRPAKLSAGPPSFVPLCSTFQDSCCRCQLENFPRETVSEGLHPGRPAGLHPAHQVCAGPLGWGARCRAGGRPAASIGRPPTHPAACRWAACRVLAKSRAVRYSSLHALSNLRMHLGSTALCMIGRLCAACPLPRHTLPAVMVLEAAARPAGYEGYWCGEKPSCTVALKFLTALAAAGPGLASPVRALGVQELAQGWRGT